MIDLDDCYSRIEAMINADIMPLCWADVHHVLTCYKICGHMAAENMVLAEACKELSTKVPDRSVGFLAVYVPATVLLGDFVPALELLRASGCQIIPCALSSKEKTYRVEIILLEESKKDNELLRIDPHAFRQCRIKRLGL